MNQGAAQHPRHDLHVAVRMGGEPGSGRNRVVVAGVSQHFKAWVDMVITDPRMAAGTQPILAGKPAVLAAERGGNYRVGTSREGWDHATGWMRRILADVWHLDLNVVQAEFTLVGVNPALDQFTDLARQLRQEAEAQARRHGRALGAAVATAPPEGRH